MQEYFHRIAGELSGLVRGQEQFSANFAGEDTHFVRFNQGRIRQAGTTSQRDLEIDLIDGRRRAASSLDLTGSIELDRGRLREEVQVLREILAVSAEDPFSLYATEVRSSERIGENALPEEQQVLDAVQRAGADRDLVGSLALGGMCSGFANSLGQRNWHEAYSYNLTFSFYQCADKAVQSGYAGFRWQDEELERKCALAAEQLHALAREPRTVEPGRYRVYLAPEALRDIALIVGRGVGLRSHRTKTTPLLQMVERGARLSPAVTVLENTAEGVAPDFQERGFIKPARVDLIREGCYQNALVSPRSAAEYGVATNGASGIEMPESMEMGPGDLPTERVLAALGTGIYVSNLHYLSLSDRNACRTTGLTRFATFWVENGAIKAPLSVMRFDETLYNMLGDNLIALTAERDMLLSSATYGRRSHSSFRLPGALIDDFTFTL